MDRNQLSIIIQYYRKKQRVSQEDLCRKLCSVTTISRIERGEMHTPMMMAETLMERLGVTADRFELFLDDEDYEYFEWRSKIQEAIKEKHVKKAEQEILKYERSMERDKLSQQFIMLQQAKISLIKQEPPEKTERLLSEAAAFTIPLISEKRDVLLSKTEIDILLTKVTEYRMENLLRVRDYMKKYYSMELKEDIYPMIQLEIAKQETAHGNYQKALAEIEEGLDVIYNERSYQYCADLHFLYAQCLEKISMGKEGWKEIREECIKRCLQAYYLYDFDEDERKTEVERYLREVLQCQSIAQGSLSDSPGNH